MVTSSWQPVGVWGIVRSALRVYIAKANTLFVIVLLLVVPISVVLTLLTGAVIPSELKDVDPATTTGNPFEGLTFEDFQGLIAVGVIGGLISFVVSMVAIGACFEAVADDLSGRETSWRSSIAAAWSKAASLVWLPIIMGLLFLAGLIAAGIVIVLLTVLVEPLGVIAIFAAFAAAIYIFVSWSVAIPVLMAEDIRGMRALWRATELVKGRWWPTFGAYFIAVLLILVISLIINAIFGINNTRPDDNLFLTTLGNALSQLIFTPFQAAIVAVVYFDMRSRKAEPIPPAAAPPPPPPPY